jgi:hypothetical protein
VSLLSRKHSGRHLDEAALTEIWTTASASGRPPSDPHLTACAECRLRYHAFAEWLEDLRDDARAEADELFPPERLASQQAHVLRRLEAMERPARVLAFPRFGRPVTSTQGNAQRWVAAAAAAGLVIGLAAGQFVDIRNTFSRPAPQPTNTTARLAPTPNTAPDLAAAPNPSVSDETLLYGAEAASSYVRISALQPMDDITPRARDLDRPR